MSASEPIGHSVVDPDRRGRVRADCYVRSSVPAAVSGQVSGQIERLRVLRDRGCIDDVRVSRWPPQQPVSEESGTCCNDIVAEFERWADRHGYSLEPGFRRRDVAPLPPGFDTERRERIRVPLVAVALYEDDADADVLRGVIPCTERTATGDERTYTVDEWLATVEARTFDEPARSSQSDRPTLIESERPDDEHQAYEQT